MENNIQNMIIEMAHNLGETIKTSSVYARYEAADKAFRESGDINRLITEYNAQQTALAKVYANKEVDRELITAIEGRVNTLYFEITENEIYKEFVEAKDDIDALIKSVNDEILFAITGERPHSCGGDCSACGGGCSHSHDEHCDC